MNYSPWPGDFLHSLSGRLSSSASVDRALRQHVSGLELPRGTADRLFRLYYPLAAFLEDCLVNSLPPVVLGINGAQGTGKSTAAAILKILLAQRFDRRVAALSIDDLYFSREVRRNLANRIHPLLMTRGVPGTHDLELGLKVLESLQKAEPGTKTVIPRFDKARDQPFSERNHEIFIGRPDVLVFEGWCVGAVPEPASSLEAPVNDLERLEDTDGKWRRYVNRCLADYQRLFEKINILAMLKAPSFGKVYEWREQQERKLENSLPAAELRESRIMGSGELSRFLMHYERLTRWMLHEMPGRAQFVFELDDRHAIEKVVVNTGRLSS